MQGVGQDVSVRATERMPLIIDLDGTLIGSDLLVESAFGYLSSSPWRIGALVVALARGKAALKSHIAAANDIDVSHLPYNENVLDLIHEARRAGRPVYLASASNQRYVRAVASHLGLFDGWFASDDAENLSSAAKARRLVEAFGHGGFDYIGNGNADFAVWDVARRRIVVNPSSAVRAKLLKLDPEAVVLARPADRLRTWVKLLRVHQWAKNALVLVSLLTAHKFDPASFALAIAAFFAFSLAASGIYIVNDLADVEADRKHRSKKYRPLAAGTIPMPEAMATAAVLVAAAVLGAFAIAPAFGGVLCAYIALTTAYTFVLKRRMMVDVVALAMLYTIRVIGGAAAISVAPSEWLLAFSMFMFASLALIKRYTELAGRLDANQPDPTNRNYRKTDMDIVAALAATAGFNAVTVFSLYVSSDTVQQLYTYPQLLWLICPILMYWIGRALIMAHRRLMDDDPILFAVKDWNSLVAAAAVGAILFAAI